MVHRLGCTIVFLSQPPHRWLSATPPLRSAPAGGQIATAGTFLYRGSARIRTGDIQVCQPALCHLSYGTILPCRLPSAEHPTGWDELLLMGAAYRGRKKNTALTGWRNRPDSNRRHDGSWSGLANRRSTSYAYCSVKTRPASGRVDLSTSEDFILSSKFLPGIPPGNLLQNI